MQLLYYQNSWAGQDISTMKKTFRVEKFSLHFTLPIFRIEKCLESKIHIISRLEMFGVNFKII